MGLVSFGPERGPECCVCANTVRLPPHSTEGTVEEQSSRGGQPRGTDHVDPSGLPSSQKLWMKQKKTTDDTIKVANGNMNRPYLFLYNRTDLALTGEKSSVW